jgi:hypothetical protein
MELALPDVVASSLSLAAATDKTAKQLPTLAKRMSLVKRFMANPNSGVLITEKCFLRPEDDANFMRETGLGRGAYLVDVATHLCFCQG